MTHIEIIHGLLQLGFTTGWVLTGDDYENIIWELEVEKPSVAALKTAATKYQDTQTEVAKSATAKLEKLGITAEELRAILGM